jgi:hypothetical protein
VICLMARDSAEIRLSGVKFTRWCPLVEGAIAALGRENDFTRRLALLRGRSVSVG